MSQSSDHIHTQQGLRALEWLVRDDLSMAAVEAVDWEVHSVCLFVAQHLLSTNVLLQLVYAGVCSQERYVFKDLMYTKNRIF